MNNKLDEHICGTDSCSPDCDSCTQNFNPLLTGINIEDRAELDYNRNQVFYKKGSIIFREKSYPSGLYCLSKGKVMITKSDDQGNTTVTNLHKEVTFLGTTDYLSGLPYQSTCIALSDVRVCLIKSDAIEKLISTNPVFSKKLLNSISIQYHQASNRLLALTKKNMHARVADALILLDNIFGNDDEGYIDVYLKRIDIAHICNMSDTNVIRHITALSLKFQ